MAKLGNCRLHLPKPIPSFIYHGSLSFSAAMNWRLASSARVSCAVLCRESVSGHIRGGMGCMLSVCLSVCLSDGRTAERCAGAGIGNAGTAPFFTSLPLSLPCLASSPSIAFPRAQCICTALHCIAFHGHRHRHDCKAGKKSLPISYFLISVSRFEIYLPSLGGGGGFLKFTCGRQSTGQPVTQICIHLYAGKWGASTPSDDCAAHI